MGHNTVSDDTTAQPARQTTRTFFSGCNKTFPPQQKTNVWYSKYIVVCTTKTNFPPEPKTDTTAQPRVKKAYKFRCLPLSPAFNKAKLYHLHPKILATKWRMDIGRDGYWNPHVSNSSALSVPTILKAVAAQKK